MGGVAAGIKPVEDGGGAGTVREMISLARKERGLASSAPEELMSSVFVNSKKLSP